MLLLGWGVPAAPHSARPMPGLHTEPGKRGSRQPPQEGVCRDRGCAYPLGGAWHSRRVPDDGVSPDGSHIPLHCSLDREGWGQPLGGLAAGQLYGTTWHLQQPGGRGAEAASGRAGATPSEDVRPGGGGGHTRRRETAGALLGSGARGADQAVLREGSAALRCPRAPDALGPGVHLRGLAPRRPAQAGGWRC